MGINIRKLIVLCGSTASGKSELAMKLATELGGEIISADSMQIYRGLDIGTAKASADERHSVPHHLVDALDISEPLNVYRFTEMAEKAIRDIESRGSIPLIVGGSGMYIRALLYGLDPLPSDDELRLRLEKEYGAKEDFSRLKEEMSKLDPLSFERWKNHQRKLLRAMEVREITGKSILELQKTWNGQIKYHTVSIFLSWDRDELRKRIEARTDEMLGKGWIVEAEEMISRGLLNSPTARQSLGYAIIGSYLRGEIGFEEMRRKIISATCQLARRQESWFRNKHPEAQPVHMPASYDYILRKILEGLRS